MAEKSDAPVRSALPYELEDRRRFMGFASSISRIRVAGNVSRHTLDALKQALGEAEPRSRINARVRIVRDV